MKTGTMYSKLVTFVLIITAVMAACVLLSVHSLNNLKEKIAEQIRKSLQIYIDEKSQQLLDINNSLLNILLNDEKLKIIRQNEVPVDVIYSANQIRAEFEEFQRSYGKNYTFFMFTEDEIGYDIVEFAETAGQSSTAAKARLYDFLKTQVFVQDDQKVHTQWNLIELDHSQFLIKAYYYDDVMIGSALNCSDLLAPIRIIDIGKEGFYFVFDSQGDPGDEIYRLEEKQIEVRPDADFYSSGKNNELLVVNIPFQALDCSIGVVVSDLGGYNAIWRGQTGLLWISVFLILLLCGSFFYMYRTFVKPWLYFSNHLDEFLLWEQRTEEDWPEETSLNELDRVKLTFREASDKIKKLRIQIYEEQLERQKEQLDYYQVQIRPHFFLNFVSLFHSLAQTGRNEEIVQLSMELSEYLRYVFTGKDEQIALKEELRNIQLYLSIQQKRLLTDIRCDIQTECSIDHLSIPPLLLQTFTENAVKHGMKMNSRLDLRILIRNLQEDGEETISIILEDNGSGFPDEILRALQEGEELADYWGRRRIGIRNAIQRVRLLYGENGRILFSNNEKGARVEIRIRKSEMIMEEEGVVRL